MSFHLGLSRVKSALILSILTLLASASQASAPHSPSSLSHHQAWGPAQSLIDENSELYAGLSDSDPLTSTVVSLVKYIEENISDLDPDQEGVERYNRLQHFGSWQKPHAKDCRNTRAHVLIRDANPDRPIKMSPRDHCKVDRAEWYDPYSDDVFKEASAIEVDHVVPLKNAYYAGGYKWKNERRCHYFNFMANDFHLRSVSGTENGRKGANGPERYMPPNKEFHCQYLKEWMSIKAIWELTLTLEEVDAIKDFMSQRGCSKRDTVISARELAEQREESVNASDVCLEFGNRREMEVLAHKK